MVFLSVVMEEEISLQSSLYAVFSALTKIRIFPFAVDRPRSHKSDSSLSRVTIRRMKIGRVICNHLYFNVLVGLAIKFSKSSGVITCTC